MSSAGQPLPGTLSQIMTSILRKCTPLSSHFKRGENSIFVGFGTGIKVLVFLEYEEVLQ